MHGDLLLQLLHKHCLKTLQAVLKEKSFFIPHQKRINNFIKNQTLCLVNAIINLLKSVSNNYLINTNIIAVHVLTKLFLKDMVKNNKGKILNVASIAGFAPGPLMAAYYSSKAYVLRLTESIYEELKKQKLQKFLVKKDLIVLFMKLYNHTFMNSRNIEKTGI